MALRSAAECAAILDVCRTLHLAEEATLASGRDLLVRIVSMLTRMAKPGESGTGTGTGTGTSTEPYRHEIQRDAPSLSGALLQPLLTTPVRTGSIITTETETGPGN